GNYGGPARGRILEFCKCRILVLTAAFAWVAANTNQVFHNQHPSSRKIGTRRTGRHRVRPVSVQSRRALLRAELPVSSAVRTRRRPARTTTFGSQRPHSRTPTHTAHPGQTGVHTSGGRTSRTPDRQQGIVLRHDCGPRDKVL